MSILWTNLIQMRVFDIGVLRRIFGSESDKVTGMEKTA